MYRNLENLGRGNPTSNSDSGSSQTGAIPASQGTSTSTTQHEQRFGASNSQFVPSLNAITSNQDLQWLVQPSFMAASGPSISPRPPYPPVFGVRPLSNYPTQSHLSRPGVIREAANSGGSTRRRNDEHLSPEELERRRIRRERNKQAAAKCRNRRRELTDTLQNETDHLEDDKARLQKEIAELQKEKEKLELVLEAHRPICKIEDTDSDSDPIAELPSMSLVGIKMEPGDRNHRGPLIKSKPVMYKPKPKINIPAKPVTSACVVPAEGESLHTPIVISTPSLTPFTASLIFTYPSGSLETNASVPSQTSLSSQQCASQQSRIPEPCSIAHRRSSSSGDQSDHSLNSPTIFTL